MRVVFVSCFSRSSFDVFSGTYYFPILFQNVNQLQGIVTRSHRDRTSEGISIDLDALFGDRSRVRFVTCFVTCKAQLSRLESDDDQKSEVVRLITVF
jgi:hypothetical protein